MAGILRGRRGEHTDTEGTEGRRPREDGGRAWSDAATSQGTPRIVSHHQKWERGLEQILPQSLRERAWPFWHLDIGLVASTAQGNKSVVGGKFLWQL